MICKHAGVHFDTTRNTENALTRICGIEQVPGSAVSASKQQHINLRLLQRARCALCILTFGFSGGDIHNLAVANA